LAGSWSRFLLACSPSEQYRTLNSKAVMVADDFRVKLYYGGTDAELQQNLTIVTQAGTELGYCKPVPQRHRDRLQRFTVWLTALGAAPAGALLP
jgi:hypothetical protein